MRTNNLSSADGEVHRWEWNQRIRGVESWFLQTRCRCKFVIFPFRQFWWPGSFLLIYAFQIHIFPQTNDGALIIYDVQVDDDTTGGLYSQNDSPFNYLRRDSAELFIKETIPSLKLNLVRIDTKENNWWAHNQSPLFSQLSLNYFVT